MVLINISCYIFNLKKQSLIGSFANRLDKMTRSTNFYKVKD